MAAAGYLVTLVGRKRKTSVALLQQSYFQKRLSCISDKGKLFYIEYNIRLFFHLLFSKYDIIGAVDLDTLLPCYLVSKIRGKKLVFDAHEHFTELIEVVSRPRVQGVWLALERFVLPKVKYAYTVSENLRQIFNGQYGKKFQLIRNVSEYETYAIPEKKEKYIIYAGAVNLGRGLHEFIDAMKYIDAKLYICGKGDIFDELSSKVKNSGLQNKVVFLGYIQPTLLKEYIRNAYIGCLLLENKGLSYYYSLANKFFDYMHAGIPQITIDFPEYRLINDQYRIAELIDLKVEDIVRAANKLLSDEAYYRELSANALKASQEYNWQRESEKLLKFYKDI